LGKGIGRGEKLIGWGENEVKETAARRFNEVLHKKPADGPSLLYLERLKACCEMAEDAEWDSVTAFTKK